MKIAPEAQVLAGEKGSVRGAPERSNRAWFFGLSGEGSQMPQKLISLRRLSPSHGFFSVPQVPIHPSCLCLQHMRPEQQSTTNVVEHKLHVGTEPGTQ